MNKMQHYFRDVSVRLGLTQEEIAEMCDVDRSTVTKWMSPTKDHSIRKDALQRYRESLVKKSMYDEAGLFDQICGEMYPEEQGGFGKGYYFDAEYQPMPFSKCLSINKELLPDCLYNEADIYDFTTIFPDKLHFEMMVAVTRYGDIITATDKVFPGKSQTERFRYENLYKLRADNLKRYGITEDFFTKNILLFERTPRNIGEIPENIRNDIYKERFKQLYCGDKPVNINNLLDIMLEIMSDKITIKIESDIKTILTRHEMGSLATEKFMGTYLSDIPISYEGLYSLFSINPSDNNQYIISLTNLGNQITEYFFKNR